MALGTSVCFMVVLSLVAKESYAQSSVFGQAPLNTSIAGGQNTSAGSWPWLARLYRNGMQWCEGSLINRKWVLTAAQCFSSNITDGWIVYLGQQTQQQSNPNGVGRNLSRIIQHPNYTTSPFDYNIALVELQSAVNFTEYIQPVSLAAKGSTFYSGTDTWVFGWDYLSYRNAQQMEIPVVGNRQCYCLYSATANLSIPLPSFNTTQNFLCAGQLARGGSSTCQRGHVGSPLVAKYGNIWVQAGVVNYGCVQPGFPGVYARVSQYEDWINSTITSDKPGFVTFTSNGTDSDNNVTCATPSSIKNSSQVLGQAPLNTSIAGGQNTSAGSWPWLARLYQNGMQRCEGSLINRKWVLTAAQCFSRNITDGWIVYLGQQTQQQSNPNGVGRNLSRIIQHPNYTTSPFNYDIALVELQSAVNFTEYIQPISLAAKGSTFCSGTDTWITDRDFPLSSNAYLQQMKLPVVQCYSLFFLPLFKQNVLCTGKLASGRCYTSQRGSHGSPLVAKYGNIWVQAGVVNYACDLSGFSGLHARVSQYEDWITSTITSDKPGFVTFTSNGTDSDNNVTCATPSSITNSSQVLGQAPLNTSIVGSQNTSAGSWPWLARLYWNGMQCCEGSLINRKWVLTAAQCFLWSKSNFTDGWIVYLGQQIWQQSNPNGAGRTLRRVIQHPNYTTSPFDYNIALVELHSAVNFTEYIQPISLAAKGSTFYSGTDTWITDQDYLSYGYLQQMEIPVVGNRQCYCLYSKQSNLLPPFNATQNFLCAGQLARGGSFTCQHGSLGSPLVAKYGNIWVQAGVGNYGCVQPGLPGLHARVSQYVDWINSTITSDKPSFVTFTSNGTDSDNNVTCATPSSITNSSQVLGQAPFNTSIVWGQSTSAGRWPWLAILYWNFRHLCEGSLINRKWVLTAAQCFSSNITDGWIVYLGQQIWQQSNPNGTERTLRRIIQHPNYTAGQLDYNIALVELQSAVNFTEYIQPVSLAAKGSTFYSGTDTWVFGWDYFSYGYPQQMEIPVVGNRQCYCLYSATANQSNLLPPFNATQNFLCAGQLARGGNSTCQRGPFGSPLVAKYGNIWVQAGVGNYGCVQPGLPGVYARVSQYVDWINSTITSDKPGFVTFTSNGTDSDNNVTCAGVPPPPTPTPSLSSTSTAAPIITSTSTTTAKPDVCGLAPLNNVGSGVSVAAGAWPWQVSLRWNGLQVCGGTLITRKYVMSAAECFNSSVTNSSQWTVVLGVNVSLGVSDIKKSSQTGSNIALLRLATSVTLNDFIQPVCLDLDNTVFTSGAKCWVTGSSIVQGGVQSLQQQDTTVENCATASTTQICTGALSSLTDYTGGSLVSKSRRSWFQGAVIMTSTSSTRAAPQQVFTAMSAFKDFIGKEVGQLPQADRAGQHFSVLLSLTLPLLSFSLMSVWGH